MNEGGDRDKLGRGWVWRGEIENCIHQNHVFRIRITKSIAIPDFISRYANEFGRNFFFEQGTQTTNLASISQRNVSTLPVPLPPLAEQRRILAKLDKLTTHLARARAELERTMALSERLRSAGLESAFSGRLRSEARTSAKTLPPDWRIVRFDEIAEIASNLVTPNSVLDLPHIAPNHIASGRPNLLAFNTIRQDGVKSAKNRFFPGQILYSKIRPYLRKVILVDFDGACSADMYPINPKCHPRYLMYWMLSPQFTWLTGRQEGRTVLPKINQSALSAIRTPLPPSVIQEQIAMRLDSIFARADRLEAEATRAQTLLDRLETSLIAKAFRGDLIPQDPNDEPASVLLERAHATRAARPDPSRGRASREKQPSPAPARKGRRALAPA
jgi:type I restriction enzyme S subunit